MSLSCSPLPRWWCTSSPASKDKGRSWTPVFRVWRVFQAYRGQHRCESSAECELPPPFSSSARWPQNVCVEPISGGSLRGWGWPEFPHPLLPLSCFWEGYLWQRPVDALVVSWACSRWRCGRVLRCECAVSQSHSRPAHFSSLECSAWHSDTDLSPSANMP